MQNIVIKKRYRFVAPHPGTFLPALLLRLLPLYLRRWHGVTEVSFRGVERLRASIRQGHRILLTPNHCRPCDPMVVGMLAGQLQRYFYIMASWHVFMQNPVQTWLLRRAGVFSVHRESRDRQSLNHAIKLLSESDRLMLIFPEGVISRHNDRLNHLMEGTAVIARAAARRCEERPDKRRVVIHPLAIRYFFEGDLEEATDTTLSEIEARMTWQPQRDLGLVPRVLKIGNAMLALKEIEYFGEPRHGGIEARVHQLVDRLLGPLETQWLGKSLHGSVVQRVKLLRKAILAEMADGNLSLAEQERRDKHLGDLYLAQQLAMYPAGYFDPEPTPERILETIERFEEDTTDVVRVYAPIRALVDVGEAIEAPPEPERSADGDALMAAVREQLVSMLAASLAEAYPQARMK